MSDSASRNLSNSSNSLFGMLAPRQLRLPWLRRRDERAAGAHLAAVADSVADSVAAEGLAAVVDPAVVAADSVRLPGDRLDLVGVPLDVIGVQEIEQRLGRQVDSVDSGLLHVVTLNPEYVVASRSSTEFRIAIEHAELSAPDGVGVVLAVRLLNHRRIARVTGVELANWLLTSERARTCARLPIGYACFGGRASGATSVASRRSLGSGQSRSGR